jgi:hypothetical protein
MYLTRSNRQFFQYTNVVGSARLTGVAQFYTSVTGAESTNLLTIAGNTLRDGNPAYFQSLAGGAGLSTNVTYWVINTSGSTFQLALTPGGAAINFTTNITSGVLVAIDDDDNVRTVWSSEYRNQFSTVIRSLTSNAGAGAVPSTEINLPATIESVVTSFLSGVLTVTPTYLEMSDEAAGVPLRQDPLRKTFWRFNVGSADEPVYLYAEFVPGDAVSNNPPNTVVTA